MRYEKSCGAIVFTRQNNEIQYVIICSTGGEYGFPKGHMEPGEDEYATALREIREEVGVAPTIIEGFRMEESYPLPNKPGVTKKVVYFLAEYADQQLRYQPEELSDVFLMPYEEALRTLTFEGTKKMLREANRFLGK